MCVCEHVRARFFARAVMSDVRDALPALCEYINLLINVGLTSEHLRLAKGNVSNEDAVSTAIDVRDSNALGRSINLT